MAAAVLADRVFAGCVRCANAARSRCVMAAAGLPAARLSRAPRQRAFTDVSQWQTELLNCLAAARCWRAS